MLRDTDVDISLMWSLREVSIDEDNDFVAAVVGGCCVVEFKLTDRFTSMQLEAVPVRKLLEYHGLQRYLHATGNGVY